MLKKITSLVLSMCLCLAASAAQARTLPLTNPKPNDPNNLLSCWQWFDAPTTTPGLKQTCAGTFAADFALPVDEGGTHNMLITAARPTTSSQVSCQWFTVTNTGGFTPGPVVNLGGTSTGFQTMNLTNVNVPVGGTLWVRCMVRQGARILSADYSWLGF